MGNHRGAYVANQPWFTRLYWGFLSSVACFWSLWSSNGCFGGDLRGSCGNRLSNCSRLPEAKRGFDRQSSWAQNTWRNRSPLIGRVTSNLYRTRWPLTLQFSATMKGFFCCSLFAGCWCWSCCFVFVPHLKLRSIRIFVWKVQIWGRVCYQQRCIQPENKVTKWISVERITYLHQGPSGPSSRRHTCCGETKSLPVTSALLSQSLALMSTQIWQKKKSWRLWWKQTCLWRVPG